MIHPSACWRIHITCPRCGVPVSPVALAMDRPVMLDTRAIVECVPCRDRWIVEVTLRSESKARKADTSIDTLIRQQAEQVARERREVA